METEKPVFHLTNWKYKGLEIVRSEDDKLYIRQHGNLYPINYELPKTIMCDYSDPIDSKDYSLQGRMGMTQEW